MIGPLVAEVGPAGVLRVLCGRGCGGALDIDQQMVTNMVALGQSLEFQHASGQCPTELEDAAGERQRDAAGQAPLAKRRFRLQILVWELDPDVEVDEALGPYNIELPGAELMAGFGVTSEAVTFAKAVNGPMTEWFANRSIPTDGGRRFVSPWERFQETAAMADLPARAAEPVPEPDPEPAERRTGPGGAVLL